MTKILKKYGPIALGCATSTALAGLGMFLLCNSAFAQAVALGSPVEFIQSVARAALLGGGAVATMAGGYKALQVWSGGRNVYEAATWLMGGMALFFGTAAVLGFN